MPATEPVAHAYNTLQTLSHHQELHRRELNFTKRRSGLRANADDRPDGASDMPKIQIADTCVMMADDIPEIGAFSPDHYGGSPVSMHFYVDDCERDFSSHRGWSQAGAGTRRQPYGDAMRA